MESIIDNEKRCLVCGNPQIEIHHVFFGSANRKNADKYGLTVPICVEHHRGKNGVHQNRQLDLGMKKLGQTVFENKIGSREEFMAIFGKNYLD